jgi:hypothetical protein
LWLYPQQLGPCTHIIGTWYLLTGWTGPMRFFFKRI